MANLSKAPDFILAIAGWETLYSVAKDTYTLAGDLANFTTMRKLMNVPRGAGEKLKGRPESANATIGELTIEIQDRVIGGSRHGTDLASRFAYLLDQSTGNENQLNGAHTRSVTTITVDSTTGFASSGNIWVGTECINYTSTNATQFLGCTRGYLLTDQMAHRDNVRVYDYKPSIVYSRAWLYKGTQNLALGNWVKEFAGTVRAVGKSGTNIVLTIESALWDTWRDGGALIMNANMRNGIDGQARRVVTGDDFHGWLYGNSVTVDDTDSPSSGSWALHIGNEWLAVRSAT